MTPSNILHNAQRIVIKTGSALVTDKATGKPRTQWMESLVADIAAFRAQGKEVILVTSGAVALGRPILGFSPQEALELPRKQAAAACGQVALMEAWKNLFSAQNIPVAQLLLTLDISEYRRLYLNARHTVETLLELGVVPVVNENDTIATAKLRFGDNDRLAARVAEMASADVLLILSDIDGFYTADPTRNPDARKLDRITALTPEIEAMAGKPTSDVGTGGMVTKLQAVKIAFAAGCHTWIGEGHTHHPISHLVKTQGGSWFIASSSPISARKRWIAGMVNPSGYVKVDRGAEEALKDGNSLLAVGVKDVGGEFGKGDAVHILNADGRAIGIGLVNYDAEEVQLLLGKKSDQFEQTIGYKGKNSLIHRNDLVMLS